MLAVDRLEVFIINLPVLIAAMGAAIASIITAKHGSKNKEKIEEMQNGVEKIKNEVEHEIK